MPLAPPVVTLYRSVVNRYVKVPPRPAYAMANILIVDDEEMDRLLESRVVEQAGHTPFFAGDGEAAVQMYMENDIQLVITDLRMPKLDGLSLIRRILSHDPDARIIAVSGLAQHLDAAEASGAIAGLVKPVRPQDLIATVEEVLGEMPSPLPKPFSRPTGEDLFGN